MEIDTPTKKEMKHENETQKGKYATSLHSIKHIHFHFLKKKFTWFRVVWLVTRMVPSDSLDVAFWTQRLVSAERKSNK